MANEKEAASKDRVREKENTTLLAVVLGLTVVITGLTLQTAITHNLWAEFYITSLSLVSTSAVMALTLRS